jgi:hypothetical protein
MPCEDLQACIARISQRLAQSGVRAVVLTPQACGRSGHVLTGARIEVPISE